MPQYLLKDRWDLSLSEVFYKLEEQKDRIKELEDELDNLKNNLWM